MRDRGSAPLEFDFHSGPSGVRYTETPMGWCLAASSRSALSITLVLLFIITLMPGLAIFYIGAFLFYGIPFVLIATYVACYCALLLFGQVRVSVNDYRGELFQGVWPVGLRRNFDWRDVTGVRESTVRGSYLFAQGEWLPLPTMGLILDGPQPIAFGGRLTEERRRFVRRVLEQKLTQFRADTAKG